MKTGRFAVTTACFILSAAAVVALKNVDVASAEPNNPKAAATSQSTTPPNLKTNAKEVADEHDTTTTMNGKVHGPHVFFVSPADGAQVSSPVELKFGVDGYQVKPAGNVDALTGHHHLIIDGAPTPTGEVVPANATHVHFGKGQTSDRLKLSPGPHTLTLQFADGSHKSYGPGMSATIHVTVK